MISDTDVCARCGHRTGDHWMTRARKGDLSDTGDYYVCRHGMPDNEIFGPPTRSGVETRCPVRCRVHQDEMDEIFGKDPRRKDGLSRLLR